MDNQSEEESLEPEDDKPLFERPLECSECRKPIAVRYTEIVGGVCSDTVMCTGCPELQRRLFGVPHDVHVANSVEGTELACGNCGTSLAALRMGTALGCNECYNVFHNAIIAELQAAHKIPQRAITNRKTNPLHIGRAPGEIQEINPSLRLLALNEALNDVLKKEDYEQAAWLRDQIKALTEPPEKPNE